MYTNDISDVISALDSAESIIRAESINRATQMSQIERQLALTLVKTLTNHRSRITQIVDRLTRSIDALQTRARQDGDVSFGNASSSDPMRTSPLRQSATIMVPQYAPRKSDASISVPIPVPIADGLAINAKIVQSVESVLSDGCIYYIQQHACFAVKINGIMLYGDIGNIGHPSRHKTQPCKYGATCTRRADNTCAFYHDPIKCGGNDRRNFTDASWIYTPAIAPRVGTRHIGDRSQLSNDVAHAKPDDVDLALAQAMHGVLVSISSYEALRAS